MKYNIEAAVLPVSRRRLPCWSVSPVQAKDLVTPASSVGCLRKGAFYERLSREPVTGQNLGQNRPVLLSHYSVYHTAILGRPKKDGPTPAPTEPHRLCPGATLQSCRCSQRASCGRMWLPDRAPTYESALREGRVRHQWKNSQRMITILEGLVWSCYQARIRSWRGL